MSHLFIYFGLFFLGCLLWLGLFGGLSFFLRLLVLTEIRRARSGPFLSSQERARFLFAGLSAMLLVSVALAWAMGLSPLFSLLDLVLAPLLLPRLSVLHDLWRRRHLDRSALTFLLALRGLIAVGLSLPAALFHLSREIEEPFAEALDGSLRHYADGKTLEQCLIRFRSRGALPLTGGALSQLEMVYRGGLPVLPLLDRLLPTLEMEWQSLERMRSVRRSALAQMAVAFAMPWMVQGAMIYFRPAGSADLWPSFELFVGILAWEAIGVVCLWKTSCFF